MEKLQDFISDITEVIEIDDSVLLTRNVNTSEKIRDNWRLKKVLNVTKRNFEALMNLEFFNPYLKKVSTMCHYQLIFNQFEEEVTEQRKKTPDCWSSKLKSVPEQQGVSSDA